MRAAPTPDRGLSRRRPEMPPDMSQRQVTAAGGAARSRRSCARDSARLTRRRRDGGVAAVRRGRASRTASRRPVNTASTSWRGWRAPRHATSGCTATAGLLHPPLRVGRIALFNDTHLTRLRLITSMLDRGYNIAHVQRDALGVGAGQGPGRHARPRVGDRRQLGHREAASGCRVADARRLVDDDAGFDRMVGARPDPPRGRRARHDRATQTDRGVQRDPPVRRHPRQAHRHPRTDRRRCSTRSAASWCRRGSSRWSTRSIRAPHCPTTPKSPS